MENFVVEVKTRILWRADGVKIVGKRRTSRGEETMAQELDLGDRELTLGKVNGQAMFQTEK